MRKAKEEFIRSIFGKQKGALLGTGRTEMKAFTTEGAEELFFAFRICAPYAGDSMGVIAAGDEVLDHLCDPLQTEAPVCGSVLFLIAVGEVLEVLLENGLKDIRSLLGIGGGGVRTEPKRQLCLHIDR